MDLFGIGPLELILVLLFALLLFGPKDIEKTGRTLGRWLNELVHSNTWHALTNVSRRLRTLPNELMRQANLDEIQAEIQAGRLPPASSSRLAAQQGPSAGAPKPAADGALPGVPAADSSEPRQDHATETGDQLQAKRPGGNGDA